MRLGRGFREAMRQAARFPAVGATYPQVASIEQRDTNPQVGENSRRSDSVERGWLRRALDVLYGRRE